MIKRTNKILFKEVIEAIAKYAFFASDYPLILSLEVHCSAEQQNVMAELFDAILAESVVKSRKDYQETTLPSPEALKGKIILKGKVVSNPNSSDSEDASEHINGEHVFDRYIANSVLNQLEVKNAHFRIWLN